MLQAVLDMTSASIGATFIQYSSASYPTLAKGEAAVNDAIYRRLYYRGFLVTPWPARFAGLTNLQDVGPDLLDAGGVHPTAAGYEVYGHKFYDAVHGTWGLPDIPYAYPPLTGHRP
jgi:hypothetical protein